jgi:ribosomal protein S18 acetylase RimI-like enzyme
LWEGNAVSFVVEKVKPGELQDFINLDRLIFSEADAFNQEYFDLFDNFWIIVNGRRAGAMMLGLHMDRWLGDVPPHREGSLYIASTGILKRYRGFGLGRAVKLWQIAYARENGFTRLVAENRISNEQIIGLNESCGFQLIDVDPDFYPDPLEDAAIMELVL